MKSLNLQNDFADVLAYISQRASNYDPNTNKGPGTTGQIRRIDLGFGFEQSGWVALVFDTRPDAEPDGTWQDYIEANWVEREHWPAAVTANLNRELKVVLWNGRVEQLAKGEWERLPELLGEMLKEALLKASRDGIFAGLPRSSVCELGVEEYEGHYGWPMYEDRKKENLV